MVYGKRVLQDRYQTETSTFVECRVPHRSMIRDVMELLKKELVDETLNPLTFYNTDFSAEKYLSYYHQIYASHWLYVPYEEWSYTRNNHKWDPVLKFDVYNVDQITSLDTDKDIPLGYNNMTSSSHAPSLRTSVDIETATPEKGFPNARKDPVICISNIVQRKDQFTTYNSGEGKDYTCKQGYRKVTFVLGPCSQDDLKPGGIILCFIEERMLLYTWALWNRFTQHDYMVGHNIKRYDLSYLIERMQILKLPTEPMGRNPYSTLRIDKYKFQSKARGERVITSICGLDGCVIIDTLEVYIREKKLGSYKLNSIAQTYGLGRKADVPYAALYGLFAGKPKDIRRMVDYCVIDAQLCDQLVNMHSWDIDMSEFARVNTAVTVDQLFTRGVQVKVLSSVIYQNVLIGNPILFKCKFNSWEKDNKDDDDIEDPNHIRDLACSAPIVIPHASSEEVDAIIQLTKQVKQMTLKSFINNKDRRNLVPMMIDDKTFKEEERATKRRKKSVASTRPSPSNQVANENLLRLINAKLSDLRTEEVGYQGATVITPTLGLIDSPVEVLDFQSLYPSIMIWKNISLETKLYHSDLARLKVLASQCHRSPEMGTNPRTKKREAVYFIKKDLLEGILPKVEKYLLASRRVAKKTMNSFASTMKDPATGEWIPNPNKDAIKYDIWNSRQAKLKINCNSMYGSLGASGTLSDKDCAAAVTAWGRESIKIVKEILEKELGGVCVGGDTDSIFETYPYLDTVELLMDRMKQHAD